MTPLITGVWCLSIVVCAAVAAEKKHINAGNTAPRHLQVNDRIGNVLDHPAFAGFSRLLLPWDERRYDSQMPISDIGSLLPYHTHVDPAVVVCSNARLPGTSQTPVENGPPRPGGIVEAQGTGA